MRTTCPLVGTRAKVIIQGRRNHLRVWYYWFDYDGYRFEYAGGGNATTLWYSHACRMWAKIIIRPAWPWFTERLGKEVVARFKTFELDTRHGDTEDTEKKES